MIKSNLQLLKDGGLDRLIHIITDRSKPSILKISSDLDIYILWTITYLDKWSTPNNGVENVILNGSFDIDSIKEELENHKSFKVQLATLENCILRVYRLKNFDMDSKDFTDKDKKYIEISDEVLNKLSELLS